MKQATLFKGINSKTYFCLRSSEGDREGVREDCEGEGGRREEGGGERRLSSGWRSSYSS